MKRKSESRTPAGARGPRPHERAASDPAMAPTPDPGLASDQPWKRLELENIKKTLAALPTGSGWTALHERAAALARALAGE